jgi:hypothetical protein
MHASPGCPSVRGQSLILAAGQRAARMRYFNPITIESGPTSGSTRVFENPASRIQA